MGFTVIRDTREKVGYWDLSFYEGCDSQVVRVIKTGDYSIDGMEDLVSIERKRNSGELAVCFGNKSKQFNRMMDRMKEFRFAYIIIECSMQTLFAFPTGSGIPPRYWKRLRTNGKWLYRQLMESCTENGVEPFFCNGREEAEALAVDLLRKAYETIQSEK